jgi:SAM-dependent methyltransferase
MTLPEYKKFADGLAAKAGVENGMHEYFLLHRDRLWQTATHFDLWNLRGKKILEIGPFFSYTPFALKEQGNDVCVIEGSDPEVYPLKPLYETTRIEFTICDLFEHFGSPAPEKHRLPFADNQFDVIACWETMEHFNFNPVGFIRDLGRILKPGGRIFLTVPNMAELENRVKLLCGKSIGPPVESYNVYYNHFDAGRFLGFHWREYVLPEMDYLLRTQNLSVAAKTHLLTFQNHAHLPLSKKIKRLGAKMFFAAFPSTGNVCAIVAQKPVVA